MLLNIEWYYKWNVTQIGMFFKMKCHSKFNVTQNRISLEKNVTQNKMSPITECHLEWNVIKMKYNSKWNVIKNGMALKMEWYSK